MTMSRARRAIPTAIAAMPVRDLARCSLNIHMPAPLFAEAVLERDLHVLQFERRNVERTQAERVPALADGDALRVHRHQEPAQAAHRPGEVRATMMTRLA